MCQEKNKTQMRNSIFRDLTLNYVRGFVTACTESLCAITERCRQINTLFCGLSVQICLGRVLGKIKVGSAWWRKMSSWGKIVDLGLGVAGLGGGTPSGQCPRLGIDTIEQASFRLIKWLTASGFWIENIDSARMRGKKQAGKRQT